MPNGLRCGGSTDGPDTPRRASSTVTTKVTGVVSIAHRDRLIRPPATPTAALIPIDHSACALVNGPRGVQHADTIPHSAAGTTGTSIRHDRLITMLDKDPAGTPGAHRPAVAWTPTLVGLPPVPHLVSCRHVAVPDGRCRRDRPGAGVRGADGHDRRRDRPRRRRTLAGRRRDRRDL